MRIGGCDCLLVPLGGSYEGRLPFCALRPHFALEGCGPPVDAFLRTASCHIPVAQVLCEFLPPIPQPVSLHDNRSPQCSCQSDVDAGTSIRPSDDSVLAPRATSLLASFACAACVRSTSTDANLPQTSPLKWITTSLSNSAHSVQNRYIADPADVLRSAVSESLILTF